MPELTTTTHKIKIPESFEKTYVLMDSLLKAETAQAGHTIQCPECSVTPSTYPTLQSFEQWVVFKTDTYCDAPEDVARETLEVLGKESPWREVCDVWSWDGQEATVHYFLAGVPTGLGPWFLFQAFCEADVVETYRPIFKEIWQSLFWNGESPIDLDGPSSPAVSAPAPKLPEIPAFAPPEEGLGLARVDGHEVRLSPEHCSASIATMLHELQVDVRFSSDDVRISNASLVTEYTSDERFGFRFTFAGIHADGVATGEFEVREGESQDRRVRIWQDGWDYSLEFTGKLLLKEGWFAMVGILEKPYEDEPGLPFEAYFFIDPTSLDWSEYRFLSLAETEGVETANVCLLQIPRPEIDGLPDRLFEFQNLRELTIGPLYSYGSGEIESKLSSLDERLGALSSLQSLTIHDCEIPQLPPTVGMLENLSFCRIVNTGLTSTPPELWTLPALKYLCLAHNRIESLPEDIALPSLETLELQHNRLGSLPVSLLSSSKLVSLSLSDNPWQSLDQRFLEIPNLKLEHEERLRVFDYTYNGADGSGQVEWDDRIYMLSSHPDLTRQFIRKLESGGHTLHQNALQKIAKRALYFRLAEMDDEGEVGVTRFGGLPDLPGGLDYPTWESGESRYSYEFLAQLNCEELAPYQDYLPRSGMLYFFLNNQEDLESRVLYFDGLSSELRPGPKLELPYPLYDDFDERTRPMRGLPTPGWSLPSDYASYCNSYYFPEEAQVFAESDQLLGGIAEGLVFAEPQRHHEINGYVFTQHEGPELQAALAKRGKAEDWTVLLKLASIGGFQWWDAGELFFVIHKSDLKKADFSNVYCGLESS